MRKKNNPNELTTREKSILEFIRQKIWDSGFPPTVREIGEAVGLRSTSTVHNYLKRLELKGAIRKNPDSSRAIEVVARCRSSEPSVQANRSPQMNTRSPSIPCRPNSSARITTASCSSFEATA